MKKTLKVVSRILIAMLLMVYVSIAALNYSVVQSYLGTAAGHYFSKQWGGELRIGSLHAMPWDHLLLDNVLLVAPDNDTILDVKHLRIRFKRFPYSNMHLNIDRVTLRDGYYHLAVTHLIDEDLYITNLQHIIDYYTSDTTSPAASGPFVVDVGHLNVIRMRYKQDIPDEGIPHWEEGVNIAHMDFRDINVRAKDIHVENDDVTVHLLKFSTTERSGMRVDQVEGNVHVSPHDITVTDFALHTPKSTVVADVEIRWDGWGGHDYLADVQHDIVLHEGTSVALSDAAYWAPVLWGIEAQFDTEGHVKGTIGDMHISDFVTHWGNESTLQLTGDVKGLPDIESTVFDVDIERFRTTQNDIRALGIFKVPGSQPLAHYAQVDIPDFLLRQIDHVDMSMRVHGGWQELGTINMLLESGMGNLHADALLTPTPTGGAIFTAEMGSSGLGLKLLRTDWLSHTGFDLSMNGRIDKLDDLHTLNAEAEGRLTNSVVRGKHLEPIELNGAIRNGVSRLLLNSTDSLALFTAETELHPLDETKTAIVRLHAKRIDTKELGLMEEKYGPVSLHLNAGYEGKDLDNMQAEARLTDIRMGVINMGRVAVDVVAADGYKNLRLESDAMNASIRGQFDYPDIPLIGMQMAHELLPQYLFHIDSLYTYEAEQIANSNIYFHLHWLDDGKLLRNIVPNFCLAQDTRIDASYNSSEKLKMVLRSDSVRSGDLKLTGIGLIGRMNDDRYRLSVEAQDAGVADMILMQDAKLLVETDRQVITSGLTWDSDDHSNYGDLLLYLSEGKVKIVKPDFTLAGTPWTLEIDDLNIYNNERLHVEGNGIALHSKEQNVNANVSINGLPSDNLELQFKQFELHNISNLLLRESPIWVEGCVDGRFSIFGLNETPYFNANLSVDSCIINRQPVGDLRLRSNWNAELNTVNLSLEGNQLNANGWVELGRPDPGLNFTVDFDSFDLSLLAPLVNNFSSRFEGLLHGSLDIAGNTSSPLIVGEALVENGALKLDLTGVTYLFNDSIQFTNNLITLDNFVILDQRGNTAFIDGIITYEQLSDIRLDLQMHTDRLLVLDKPSGDEFFGTLLASAEGSVRGPVQALEVDVVAQTTPGCSLTVPVNDQRQVKSQNYITFVNDQPKPIQQQSTTKNQNLRLDLDLSITPDVQLNLPMDFSEVKVTVGASGSGDLHLSLKGNEEPQVVGSYEISSGLMNLGLLSLIEKNFTIESGSSLNFQGNLPDARFNLSAVYSQRVNLSTLTGGVSEISGTQKYLQVEDVINIAGTIQEPTIGFDIRLPGADASVEEEVYAYIDRNSERDMLNQTISLLVSGHFYNTNTTTVNGGIATSSSIGALSSILTDMVNVVDIDVDYKAGNELTKDQVDVNISKDWGRWYLESTLGYGGESRELQGNAVNSAVIDALLGYRISPLIHLFAYNRTNTNDYTRMDLPYKQGVGLKLTKDFDRWIDIFKSSEK